ncbi:hypothetical protein TSAR_010334, partial [Trichomalopsis sarcophagae]
IRSRTNVASTSPVSSLATNLLNIKTPSPTKNRRQVKIKRRLNQICSQMSEIKLSPPQQQQQSIDQEELDLFYQASTRAIELPKTLV